MDTKIFVGDHSCPSIFLAFARRSVHCPRTEYFASTSAMQAALRLAFQSSLTARCTASLSETAILSVVSASGTSSPTSSDTKSRGPPLAAPIAGDEQAMASTKIVCLIAAQRTLSVSWCLSCAWSGNSNRCEMTYPFQKVRSVKLKLVNTHRVNEQGLIRQTCIVEGGLRSSFRLSDKWAISPSIRQHTYLAREDADGSDGVQFGQNRLRPRADEEGTREAKAHSHVLWRKEGDKSVSLHGTKARKQERSPTTKRTKTSKKDRPGRASVHRAGRCPQ